MKIFITSLVLLFSSATFAKSWTVQDSSTYSKMLHLFICSEEAPILCKHFRLSKALAKEQIHQICGDDRAILEATWKNDKIIDIACSTQLSDLKCKAMGYDCLLNNQCVINLTLKPYVDQNSPEYILASIDILNHPERIYFYPQFYNICPSSKH